MPFLLFFLYTGSFHGTGKPACKLMEHDRQLRTDDLVRIDIFFLLFGGHFQNIFPDLFITAGMKQQIGRFVLFKKIAQKEKRQCRFIPHRMQKHIHECAVPDQNVDHHTVVHHFDPMCHARCKHKKITLFQNHRTALRGLFTVSAEHIDHFKKSVMMFKIRKIARMLFHGDIASLQEKILLGLIRIDRGRIKDPAFPFLRNIFAEQFTCRSAFFHAQVKIPVEDLVPVP